MIRSTFRLAPGVGGEATFAAAVSGDDPVTIPMGSGFSAKLEDQDEDSQFESTQESTAYPAPIARAPAWIFPAPNPRKGGL